MRANTIVGNAENRKLSYAKRKISERHLLVSAWQPNSGPLGRQGQHKPSDLQCISFRLCVPSEKGGMRRNRSQATSLAMLHASTLGHRASLSHTSPARTGGSLHIKFLSFFAVVFPNILRVGLQTSRIYLTQRSLEKLGTSRSRGPIKDKTLRPFRASEFFRTFFFFGPRALKTVKNHNNFAETGLSFDFRAQFQEFHKGDLILTSPSGRFEAVSRFKSLALRQRPTCDASLLFGC